MPIAIGVGLAVEAGLTIASTIQQKRAADSAASTATAVASYNEKLDQSEANQIDFDTQANIDAMRRDASVYMSRQSSAYAAAGVRVDSGSPLAVKAATAGKFELREQQSWSDSQAKEQRLASEGQAGIAEGAAKADQYHMEGVAAVMGGAAKVVGLAVSGYQAGVFSGTGTTDLSSGLGGGTGENAMTAPGE